MSGRHTKTEFGSTLSALRGGQSQAELARSVPLSASSINRYENGSQTPELATATRLDQVLNAHGELVAAWHRDVVRKSRALDASSDAGDTDMSPVAMIRGVSEVYQLADRRLGGGRLYQPLLQFLRNEVTPLITSPTIEVGGRELFAAVASITEVAGWMAYESGQDSESRRLFEKSYLLASAAGNAALEANVCASMAHLALHLGQPGDAMRIADRGVEKLVSLEAPGIQARLSMMRARAFAHVSDVSGSRRAMDVASELMTYADGAAQPTWTAVFDAASMAGEASLCLWRLGLLHDAEEQARAVTRLRAEDRLRSRTFANLNLAGILLDDGRLDEAVHFARDALIAATEMSSARVTGEVELLRNRLHAMRRSRVVANLFYELDEFATTSHNGDATKVNPWPI